VYALGPSGSGRHSAVEGLLLGKAETEQSHIGLGVTALTNAKILNAAVTDYEEIRDGTGRHPARGLSVPAYV
jgi:hypothetical protein